MDYALITQLPGWLALLVVITDRVILPLARQYAPIKSKSDAAKAARELEDAKFAHELQLREVEAQENIARLVTIMDTRLAGVEGDVKDIKTGMGELQRMGAAKRKGK